MLVHIGDKNKKNIVVFRAVLEFYLFIRQNNYKNGVRRWANHPTNFFHKDRFL